jgi:hypothetical protein
MFLHFGGILLFIWGSVSVERLILSMIPHAIFGFVNIPEKKKSPDTNYRDFFFCVYSACFDLVNCVDGVRKE